MKDIFVSYSRKDSATAEKFTKLLTEEGWSVFWDVEILPGRAWSDQLEKKLRDCKCIVVLWSKNSLQSDFVKEEAAIGKQARKLVPIMIDDGIHPPFGFGMLEAAMLSDWNGDKNNREYKNLIRAISELVPPTKEATGSVSRTTSDSTTKTATISVSKTKAKPSAKKRSKPNTPLLLLLGFLVAILCFSFFKECSSPNPVDKKPKTKQPKKEDKPVVKPTDSNGANTGNLASNAAEITRLKESISSINMSSKKLIDQELQDVSNKKKKIAAPGKFTALKNTRAELDARMKKWVAAGSSNLGQLKTIESDSKKYLNELQSSLNDIFEVVENIDAIAKRLITLLFSENEFQRKNARAELKKTYGKNSSVIGALIKQCDAEFEKDLNNKGIFQAIWLFNEISKSNPKVLEPHKQILFTFFDKTNKVYGARTKRQIDSVRRNLN